MLLSITICGVKNLRNLWGTTFILHNKYKTEIYYGNTCKSLFFSNLANGWYSLINGTKKTINCNYLKVTFVTGLLVSVITNI